MINITSLSHKLGKTEVLKGVNLTVPDSTILGLAGVNGAGKSTLLRLLAGVYLPDEGRIEFDGRSPSDAATRADIFFLSDDPYYTHNDTVGSVASIYKVMYSGFDNEYFEKTIEAFGLDTKKPLRSMSKGMRRQAYIAMALASNTKYLLFDEAFDGLDPLVRRRVKERLVALVEEREAVIVISSHSLSELESLCDRYAIIDEKTVSDSGIVSERIGTVCKFMLGFADGEPEGFFDGLPILSRESSGRFVTAFFEGDADEIEAILRKRSPSVIDRLAVDFEEVFLGELSEKGIKL